MDRLGPVGPFAGWDDAEWDAFEANILEDVPEEMIVDLTFDVDDPIANQVTIPFRFDWLWEVYRAMHCGGVDESLFLVYFGWIIHGRLVRAKAEDPLHALHSVWVRFGDTHGLEVNRLEGGAVALSFLYFLLAQEFINRTQAAALGPILIGDEDFVLPDDKYLRDRHVDNWRKRVDRWSESHNLPRAGISRPGRKK